MTVSCATCEACRLIWTCKHHAPVWSLFLNILFCIKTPVIRFICMLGIFYCAFIEHMLLYMYICILTVLAKFYYMCDPEMLCHCLFSLLFTCTLSEMMNKICPINHYSDVIMGAIASQISSLTSVYSNVYSDAGQGKHQSSVSLASVRGIHRGPVNAPHKWPVTRKMYPFDDVIMCLCSTSDGTWPGSESWYQLWARP